MSLEESNSVEERTVISWRQMIRPAPNYSAGQKVYLKFGEFLLASLGPAASFVVPSLANDMIYMHKYGKNRCTAAKLSDPLNGFNLENATHLKIESNSGNSIGAWYCPTSKQSIGAILICHGSGGNRGYPSHRVRLVKILRQSGFNVMAMDYSGFGDSSGTPNREKVVLDVLSCFSHLKNLTSGPHLIYAHSLGTAIATEANQRLCLQNHKSERPDGLILDAPLHSLRAEILDWPHGQLMQKVYSRTLIERMIDFHLEKENGEFQTFRQVLDVTNPILLIQSEDDEIVQPKNAREHFYQLCKDGKSRYIRFILFESWHNYRHDGLIYFPNFSEILSEFASSIKCCQEDENFSRFHADVM